MHTLADKISLWPSYRRFVVFRYFHFQKIYLAYYQKIICITWYLNLHVYCLEKVAASISLQIYSLNYLVQFSDVKNKLMNLASRKYAEGLLQTLANAPFTYIWVKEKKNPHALPKSLVVMHVFLIRTRIIWKIYLYASDSVHARSMCISITQKYYIMSVCTNLTWLGWPCLFHLTGRQWHQSKFLPFMLLFTVPVRILTGFFPVG